MRVSANQLSAALPRMLPAILEIIKNHISYSGGLMQQWHGSSSVQSQGSQVQSGF